MDDRFKTSRLNKRVKVIKSKIIKTNKVSSSHISREEEEEEMSTFSDYSELNAWSLPSINNNNTDHSIDDIDEEEEEDNNEYDDLDDDLDEDDSSSNRFKRRRLNSKGKYCKNKGFQFSKPTKVIKCKQSKRIRAMAFNPKRNEIAAISMNAAFHYFDIHRFEQVNNCYFYIK